MKKKLVHTLFEEQVKKNPLKVAVKEETDEISYHALDEQANLIADLLYCMGTGRDTVIAYLGNSGIDLVASLAGIFKTGSIYLPVDTDFPDIRITDMLKETNCKVGIVSENNQKDFIESAGNWKSNLEYLLVLNRHGKNKATAFRQLNSVWVEFSIDAVVKKRNADALINEDDSCYIFYTSGSTGTGKPILGSHKGLGHFIEWEGREFNLDENIRVSQLARITFDASLRDIFIPLTLGGTLYIPSESTRANMIRMEEWMDQNCISLVHTVPSVFRLLNKEFKSTASINGKRLKALKFVIMAGEPLYAKDINTWRKLVGDHVELVNLYGTSETTMAKTCNRITQVSSDPAQVIHAGKPIEGAFIAIINNGQLCSIGEIGDIYIKTPYGTKGYYKNETLTNSFFVQNPLHNTEKDIVHKTGDMGRYLPDRSIEILGRSDDQVKVNGIRLQLSEIEKCMIGCFGVDEASVLVHKNRDGDNELVGYFTGEKIQKEELRNHMVVQLGRLVVPGYLIKLDEFPLNTNGKINKKELPRPNELIIANDDYEKVWPGLETELEDMWKELLRLERIGRKLSFFEVGGNSLKAIQLISRIYKKYHVLIKINEIFTYSNIEQLAAHIQEAVDPTPQIIELLPEQKAYELSYGQKCFWAINQAQKNKSSYNVPAAFEITGKLDLSALSKSITKLVERHEILRTRFVTIEGEPMQQIIPDVNQNYLEYVDLRNANELEKTVQEWIHNVSHTEFDLERNCLLRVVVLHIRDDHYVYLVTMHHIICDAWSIEILNKEMFALYNAIVNSQELVLPALPVQYKEFAAWQNRSRQELPFENQRKFWLQNLAGQLPRTNLPLDFGRPGERKTDGKSISFFIENEQKNILQQTAREFDASLFVVSLTLLNILLHNSSGQNDIIVGSPVAGREHPDLENQVGLYINTILLRNRIKSEDSFESLVKQVKKNTIASLANQSYPFEMLIDDLKFEQSKGRNLVFDVGFTYFNENMLLSGNELTSGDFVITELDHGFHDVKADLWVKIIESSDKLLVVITYSSLLFKPAFAEKLGEDFRQLITLANANSQITVEEMDDGLLSRQRQMEKNKRVELKKHVSGKLKALQPQK